MTTIINANNSGITQTVDTSGVLQIQTANTAAITIDTSQNITCNSTGAITVSSGTTAQRPASPANGMLRYNTTLACFEVYANNTWALSNVTPPPTNTVAPVVSGSTTVGGNATVTTGTWTGSPTGYYYQWYANSTAISANATSNVFVITSTQNGANLYCNVTAYNAAGNSSPAKSNVVGPVTSTYSMSYFVMGAGAGGARNNGGGGGAGAYTSSSATVTPGTVFTATVGGGGGSTTGGTASSLVGTGLSSSAAGGNTGGYKEQGSYGGSSGGGFGGGSGNDIGGGGGAGAAGNGGNSGSGAGGQNYGGNGGAPTSTSISGSSVSYGGGGGGGQGYSGVAFGPGGGGGAGAGNGGSGNGGNATANTGSGGGGAGGGGAGGNGGSGRIVLSVPTASYSGTTTGAPTITTNGSNTIITFNSSGTYTA